MHALRALVSLLFLLGMIIGRLQAAPVPFQPYGDKSSTDVVLQLAETQKASWQVELENILPVQLSEVTQTELSAFEALIDRYQDDEQAVTLLVPLYWQVVELSGQIDQRQQFLARSAGISDDFMALLFIELLLQLHEYSLSSLNGYNDLRDDFRHQYEQLLSQLQQQEPRAFLNLWASGLLYFYMPGGGLSVADSWLQSQADSAESSEVIVVYRKILHELAGQSFPVKTPDCWPLACAEAMTTDEMERRAQRAYNYFTHDGFSQAWRFLKAGVHCLYSAQSNPLVYNYSLCLGLFDKLNSMLRILEDGLAVNGFAAGWSEYRLLKESYAETFNFQNRVSNQVQHAFRYEQERIDSIQDPETRLQASQNLLDGPLSSFASSQSIQQARQSNERQLQAIRDARKKQAAIDQAYERFQAQYQNLQQQLERHPDNEDLWEQFESLTDSEDARTGLQPSAREKLKQQAHSSLVDARENNRLNRLYQAFKKRQAEIIQRFEYDPETALVDLIDLVNSDLSEPLTIESRNTLREKYQTQLNELRAEKRAIAETNARIQSSFKRISEQLKNLREQIKQSPENEVLVQKYLNLLDGQDAQTALKDTYRQNEKAAWAKLLEGIRENKKNRTLFQQYQDEYDAIMATYNENPIRATEKALALLDSELAQSLTPESREEQREYHQNQLSRLRAKEQTEKEQQTISSSWVQTGKETPDYCSAQSCSGTSPPDHLTQATVLNWLEVIGQEQDPTSIWVNEKVEMLTNNLLRLSYEQSPALTQVFINVLVITGDLVSATFNLMDEATGQIVSRSWNSLDENTRNRIKGGEKVVSAVLLPLGLGKKTLEVTDHVLKALKKNQRPAPLKNDPYHADAVEDRRTQWRDSVGYSPSHDDILEQARLGATIELFNVNNIWSRNNGILGEELARRFSEKMGLDVKVLQNNSKHGVDLYSYDEAKNEYLVIEVKSSWADRYRLSRDQRKGPAVYLRTQAVKAAGGEGFWRPESTPSGIKADGEEVVDRLRGIYGTPATVRGVKMEVAIPRTGESGIASLTVKEWH